MNKFHLVAGTRLSFFFAFAKDFDDAVGAANLGKSRKHQQCRVDTKACVLTWRSPASLSAVVCVVVLLLSCAAFGPAVRPPSPALFFW